MPEYVWISVEKIFPNIFVIKEFAFIASQKCVRIFFECISPCFEPSTRYVDHKFFVVSFTSILRYWWWWQWVCALKSIFFIDSLTSKSFTSNVDYVLTQTQNTYDWYPSNGRCPCERQPSSDRGHTVRWNDLLVEFLVVTELWQNYIVKFLECGTVPFQYSVSICRWQSYTIYSDRMICFFVINQPFN